jgi:hypothetical protein
MSESVTLVRLQRWVVRRSTVESLLSPIFLPISLFIHSDVLSLPPELIPGTTRGMLEGVVQR